MNESYFIFSDSNSIKCIQRGSREQVTLRSFENLEIKSFGVTPLDIYIALLNQETNQISILELFSEVEVLSQLDHIRSSTHYSFEHSKGGCLKFKSSDGLFLPFGRKVSTKNGIKITNPDPNEFDLIEVVEDNLWEIQYRRKNDSCHEKYSLVDHLIPFFTKNI